MNRCHAFLKNSTFVLLAAVIWGVSPVRADEAADEAMLTQEATEHATETAKKPDLGQAEQLSKQYGIEQTKVDQMRSSGKGWGAINVELAMAQELQKKDPTTYPTLDAALDKVSAMRADGKGYGAIAKELGFKLGPVVSQSRHVRNELRREQRQERRAGRMERRAERAEHRSERMERRADRMDRRAEKAK